MPSQKSRSKEDTWTPDELNRALNKTGERRHHRDRDDNKRKERVISEDKPRRRKDEDSERRHHRDDDDRRRRRREEEPEPDVALTEDERERLRRERREKREGKDGKDRKSKGEIQFKTKSAEREIELNDINDDDDRRRRHHGDRERRHKEESDRHHKNGDSSRDRRHHDKERRHRDDDDDRERRRRHRDEEDEDEDEKERRRREKRKEKESREDEDRRRRHDEKKERRRDDDRDRKKDRDRDERSDKHRDRKDKDRDKDRDRHRDKDDRRESERDKEKRREREREERRKERDERHKEKEEKSSKSSRHKEEKAEEKEEEDEYNYEEDFEDYEEDFEDDDDDDNDDNQVQDSEVNDVLKALDAENERLVRESTDSPKYQRGSRRHDDEDSDDQYEKTYQPRQDRPKTAINFVSAKQRAISRKTANKTMQRSQDLLKMIERDFVSFDMLDMPPVNEYDLYIRAFGGSNTKQAYVQTNDDNIDREIQTEEVDTRQKWTQYPSESLKGCGRGDGEKDFEEEEESQMKHNREEDLGRLNKFLERAGQVIAILMEEDKEMLNEEQGRSKSHINISDSFTQIELLPILDGRHVVYSHFSPVQPNLLLTAYSAAPEASTDNPVSKKGIICVWNTNDASYPQKILACSSQPLCCCFSPVKPSLVFAGMTDGSIAMWDLREPSTLHQPTLINKEEYALRYPTYDTAGVLTEENHHSPVCSISPIYSYINSPLPESQQSQASDDSSGLSFQLVSTENSAILHFWVVAEIGAPDLAGSQTDLGLAPGGKVKLLKSSTLTLENPSSTEILSINDALRSNVRALDMKLVPSDPNQFYVSTDSGIVIHGVRFGNRAFPRAHAPVIETIVDVVSIDFSPFEQPCFLAGCSDGSFSLYHTRSEHPLITWTQVTHGKPVMCVKWSRSRPCVFFVLDTASTLYIFDLLEGDIGPKQVETLAKEKVMNFALTNDHKATGLGTPGKDAQMLFSMENGRTEIHTISKTLTEPEQLETDYLASYLQRF